MSKQSELDRWCVAFLDGDMSAGQFKRAVANLVARQSNEQIEAVLDRIHQSTVRGELIKGEPAYMAITRAIEAERNKLKESEL